MPRTSRPFICSGQGTLQRLYSTFANGLPGKGLLILRLVISAFLFQDCFGKQPVETANLYVAVPSMVAAGGAVLLLAGLWTPLAGILVAVLELWIAFLRPTDSWASVIAAAVALGLSLLGPGAWSIDARVYGRKRMSIHDR